MFLLSIVLTSNAQIISVRSFSSFSNRIPHNVVDGFSRNRGINTKPFWNTAKNYKSKHRDNFCSEIWKYWSNLRALATVTLIFFLFLYARVSRDINNYFRGFSTEIKFKKNCFTTLSCFYSIPVKDCTIFTTRFSILGHISYLDAGPRAVNL